MKFLKKVPYLIFLFVLVLLNFGLFGEKPADLFILNNEHEEQTLTPSNHHMDGVASHQGYLLNISSFSNGSALIVAANQEAAQMKVGETKIFPDGNYLEKVQVVNADEKSAKVVVDYYIDKNSASGIAPIIFTFILDTVLALIEGAVIIRIIEWIRKGIVWIYNLTNSKESN